MPHPGIRLRISCAHGPLLETDSDHLNLIAQYGATGWYELFPGKDMSFVGSDLVIEMLPVQLADYVLSEDADDEEDEE